MKTKALLFYVIAVVSSMTRATLTIVFGNRLSPEQVDFRLNTEYVLLGFLGGLYLGALIMENRRTLLKKLERILLHLISVVCTLLFMKLAWDVPQAANEWILFHLRLVVAATNIVALVILTKKQ